MIESRPAVSFHSFDCGVLPASVSISCFRGESGVEEYHFMVRPTEYGGAREQFEWMLSGYRRALSSLGLEQGTSVFRRFFCSDLANQATLLKTHPAADPQDVLDPCAVSLVCQPPAPPTRIALWACHVRDPRGPLNKGRHGRSLALVRDGLTHLFTTGVVSSEGSSSHDQTDQILNDYVRELRVSGLSLAENVIRTWFFVRDVDANYHGLVKARRDLFTEHGLTPETHFIASTGIQGASADLRELVMMDAYAIAGVGPEQIEFLCAPEFLSPTHIYGVTFERGVSIAYRDRKHILISGTASIDSEGRIVHEGDVLRQLDRTLENVRALLAKAGAGFTDVCSLIVYVRDPSDLDAAERAMSERFPGAPFQVVLAPVCRPGWLIEIECQAVIPASNPSLPAF